MKLNRLILLLLVTIFMVDTSEAQDYLFSQFDMMPHVYNPAQTGDYYGSVRLGGIYRDQGFAISEDRYNTPGFYVDAPIITGFRDRDWIGIGATFLQDNAGAGQLKTGEVRLNVAYHLGLDKDSENVLTFGIQGGNYFRSFGEASQLEFENEITGNGQMSSMPIEMADNKWSFGAGVLLRTQLNDRAKFRLGGAVNHLLNFEYGLAQSSNERIPLTINAHAGLEQQLTQFVSIKPMIITQFVGGDYNAAIQSYVSIQPDRQKEFYLEPGIGYRLQDAVMIFAGVQWESFKARLAYDATISPMAAANGSAGALELAAMYIIKINKPPEVEKKLICPSI